MTQLSKNFDSDEFHCPCCGQVKVDNQLVYSLQELRNLIDRPIHINSGYRCPEHNKAVGGVKNSQHALCKAADIQVKDMTGDELAKQAEQVIAFRDGGIGIAGSWIHVDVRDGKARWRYE